MFGFLLNLLVVALQSYTIYFLNSKFPETGQKIEQDIKGSTGVGNSLELSDNPTGSEAEKFQTKLGQPSEELHNQPSPSENQLEQALLQNSTRVSSFSSNLMDGYSPASDVADASTNS